MFREEKGEGIDVIVNFIVCAGAIVCDGCPVTPLQRPTTLPAGVTDGGEGEA